MCGETYTFSKLALDFMMKLILLINIIIIYHNTLITKNFQPTI